MAPARTKKRVGRLTTAVTLICASWVGYLVWHHSSSSEAASGPPRDARATTTRDPAPPLPPAQPAAVAAGGGLRQSAPQRAPPAAAPAPEAPPLEAADSAQAASARVHVVFSTDCSPYQDWQTEVVFHSAQLVGQRGPITRIASGCEEARQQHLRQRYSLLYPNRPYYIHFTPDFSGAGSGSTYKFYNKPGGMEHWLASADAAKVPVIALIDPDFIFLRPLTDVVDDDALVFPPWTRVSLADFFGGSVQRVSEGRPVAQQYGLGTYWLGFDRSKICTEPGSPCLSTTRADAAKYFPVGPPYILHFNDWRKLASVWREFAPRVYAQYPDLLAEMYAYCCAAAHLGLKHARVNHLMVSNVDVGDEGWKRLDAWPLEESCGKKTPGIVQMALDGGPYRALPMFLHYCQAYRLGDWMFAKRRVPAAMFDDCSHPLLAEADVSIHALRHDFTPPGNACKQATVRTELVARGNHINRTAAVLCLATWHTNAAAAYARRLTCPGYGPANRTKMFTLATTCHPQSKS
ncbi:hypothetical protein M885DRAFT_551527 [Pelagophyceae sp. CCMP2097]|nr:hypothetical protein M885DRAFT_551527 [Pelagophyceae sp. CCMP2097]